MFASEGASVALVSRTKAQVDEVADVITKAGGKALALVADVSQAADMERVVAETKAKFGPVTVLVNNAGVTGPYAPIWDADPEEWWNAQEVHIRGAFTCVRSVWAGMVEAGGGRIIIVASQAAERGGPNVSAYQIAKSSQLRMAESLGAEGAELGIKAFAIHPGTVDTAFATAAMTRPDAMKYVPQFGARLKAMRDDPSLATPMSAPAELCVFLASGAADAMTGRYLRATDDYKAVVAEADRIKREDLYTLRMRTVQDPNGPRPAPAPDH
jgi:NAD(P)-dependent dehydrogenase (short-subunit alcohol dehydrogenase family)